MNFGSVPDKYIFLDANSLEHVTLYTTAIIPAVYTLHSEQRDRTGLWAIIRGLISTRPYFYTLDNTKHIHQDVRPAQRSGLLLPLREETQV